jgi:putative spermidine/putrescine transport system substrate-binding protein
MEKHPAAGALGRRTAVAGTLAALAAPALAQSSRPFVVATFGGLFEKLLRDHVIPDFERQHDVHVELELGTGSTFIPKLIASGRRSPYDVVHLNDDEAFLGASAGLWAPDQSAKLPSEAAIYPSLQTSMLPMYTSVVYELPLAYRPDAMPPPTSWNDLWQPGITVGIPHISNSYGLTFLLIAALLNGGSASDFKPGFAALKRLSKFKIYKGVTQGYAMFQQGEIDAGLFYGHRTRQLIDSGVKLAAAHPKEGVWGQRTGAQIPKAAPRLELSDAWIETTLSVPYQTVFAQELYSPTNRNVILPPALAAKHITGDAAIAALKFPDWTVINPQRDALLDQWTQTFGS